MRYTQAFIKTKKDSKTYDSANATWLTKAGFIDQVMAGVYTFLPLGWRVLNKIENIIREEMNEMGAEMLMPAMVPRQLWERTKREGADMLLAAKPANKSSETKNSADYILSPTHEEVVTPLAQKTKFSYKDLPFGIYQIQTKFRNEERPKSGLMRGREFRMKDLYSFHASEEDLMQYYERMKAVYQRVFTRLGIGSDTLVALASGGDFTEGYSHEFQTICETGEDIIFWAKKAGIVYNREVAPSKAPVEFLEEKLLPQEEIKGEGIIGVQDLAKFLKIPVEKTTKTIIFETDKGAIVAAAVRGTYEINEKKLKKILRVKELRLASAAKVKEVTGAELGYAGILNLPKEVRLVIDESVGGRNNFECGANRTDYHTINVNFGRDLPEPEEYFDIKVARTGDSYPKNGEIYEVVRASEVGNIFPLNTKFSDSFEYTFTDEKGQPKPVFMGSYGIGSSRLMGVLVEKFHDDKGIIWPKAIAPFTVHLVELNGEDSVIKERAKSVYEQLVQAGVEVLYDERLGVSAGEKLADADLIGIPWRVIVSRKTGEKIEIKGRNEENGRLVDVGNFLTVLAKD